MPAKHHRPRRGEGTTQKKYGLWIFLLLATILSVWLVWISWGSRWDDDLPLTLVVVGEERLGLLQLDPPAQEAVLLTLPDNLVLSIAGMGSDYQAKALWRIGEIEGNPGQLVSASVAAFTGVWVDGYIYDPAWDGGFPFKWQQLWETGQTTDLNAYDYLMATRFLTELRADQREILKLPNNVQEIESSPDGYEVVKVNEQRLALFTRDNFASPPILSDRRTVTVANGSGTPGMARLFERMISSSGGAVVEIKEGENTESWCQGFYSGESNGVVRWLSKRVGCRMESADWERARSEIEVDLGREWGQRFSR